MLWGNASAYCLWKQKRLPTEAEWEAAAAGASAPGVVDAVWYEANSGGEPHKVASKTPNTFGLYDMRGNVWEWVSDLYAKDAYITGPRRNPKGPASGRSHVIRGGAWSSEADQLAVSNRASYDRANDDIGFRCAVSSNDLERRLEN